MFKAKRLTLDNGLQMILIRDNRKNTSGAYLTVNVGGFTKDFNMDGKDYSLDYGIAHFLEHYLIENSIYGNAMQVFGNDYIESNGFTAPYRTVFYISTVHDFEENLVKLLNIVNNPVFDKEKIETVKRPILREIDKNLDNPYRKVNEYSFNSVFKYIPYDVTLGEKDYISKLKIDDLELFHKAFYNAKNELLIVSGNFDEERIIKLVNDTYKKFDNTHDTKKAICNEPKEVVKEEISTKDKDDFIRLAYKIDISKFKAKDRDKLSYYLSFIRSSNFSERSALFKYVTDNKISNYSINFASDFGVGNNFLFLNVIMYTDKYDLGKELLLDKINNLEYDEEIFEKWKNKQVITLINNLENFANAVKDYMDNVYLYNLYQYDDIEFVKSLNLDECKELIGKLDLSNCCTIKCKKEIK